MSVYYKVQDIYDGQIQEVTSSSKNWQDILSLAEIGRAHV